MASLAAGASLSVGQVVIQSSVYQQDFNSLAASGTNTWTNNVTLEGWYAFRMPVPNPTVPVATYIANHGNTSTASLYSFGAAGSNDRALGSSANNNTNVGGGFQYGVGFTNGLAAMINEVSISYRGETWRIGTETNPNTIQFQYSFSPNAFTDSAAEWIDFNALSYFQGPQDATGIRDGNVLFADKQATISGLSIDVGSTLWLRWVDLEDPGNDHGLAIDDFEITFHTAASTPVPEPGTLALAGLACAAGIRRRFGKKRV